MKRYKIPIIIGSVAFLAFILGVWTGDDRWHHTGDTSHSITREHAESLGALMAEDREQWSDLSRKIAEESFEAQAEAVRDD